MPKKKQNDFFFQYWKCKKALIQQNPFNYNNTLGLVLKSKNHTESQPLHLKTLKVKGSMNQQSTRVVQWLTGKILVFPIQGAEQAHGVWVLVEAYIYLQI